jgi:hypothetical protein
MAEVTPPLPSKSFDSASKKRSGSTPAQVALYIRFALSQLPGENGHHKFEQLCLHLARRRIYPNLVPATGPVSAGGDQGADFETYAVGATGASDSPFFAHVSHEKVIFACSLEKNVPKKIKADLQAASVFHQHVSRLVFFSAWDVPVGKRHKLESFALQTHGIQLDIFDARFISESLADTEIFWIAQEYLSIPSEIVLATPATYDKRYQEALEVEIDSRHLASSQFLLVKDAVRFATFSPDHRSDLPGLIRKLRLFRLHPLATMQRRAFYEEFVAALRGLEAVRGLETDLEQYVSAVALAGETAELEDASILLSYAAGAIVRGLLQVDMSVVGRWKGKILDRIDSLIPDSKPLSGRMCALLFTKGFLTHLNWIEAMTQSGDIQALRTRAAADAVPIWRMMIKEASHAPMFPLERFGKLLSEAIGELGGAKDFTKLVSETDSLLAQRFGKHKLAEQAFGRAVSLYEAGKILRAIDELHSAHIDSFTKETATQSVQFCLLLAEMYSELNLHCAAKCYALAAAYAALRLDEDSLRGLAYRGLAEAASSDHANGASLSYFLSAAAFVFVSQEHSMIGSEETKQFEWARIDFYCLLLTRASALVSGDLFGYLKQTILPRLGLDEIYAEAVSRLEGQFDFAGVSSLAEKAVEEGIMPPFSDVGERRRLGWEQLGLRWFADWENSYETTKVAESFCAVLQIFLVHLARVELSLFPADVYLRIELHKGQFSIETIPDNEHVRLRIRLQEPASGNADLSDHTAIVHGVGTSVLKIVSAIPKESFIKMYASQLNKGLQPKLAPYAPYARLYEEFYGRAAFAEIYEKARSGVPYAGLVAVKTHADLSGPNGLHPQYSRKESERAIRRRYERVPGMVKFTLARLLGDGAFIRAIAALRKEGWKDWHFLLAVANIRQNYVIHQRVGPASGPAEYRAVAEEIASRDEKDSDPAPPAKLFGTEELKKALRLSQMSTLKALGFECWQQTPNLAGIDRFLRRFNYWTDDLPHPSIFPE